MRQPHLAAEHTRRHLDRTPATIVRGPVATAQPSETTWTRSAADQLADLDSGDDWKRYVPIIGARPGYIPHTQPERQTLTNLARLERLALEFVTGTTSTAATVPDLPPPSQ